MCAIDEYSVLYAIESDGFLRAKGPDLIIVDTIGAVTSVYRNGLTGVHPAEFGDSKAGERSLLARIIGRYYDTELRRDERLSDVELCEARR